MGNRGSYTAKATIRANLFPFTSWGTKDMEAFFLRSDRELSESFSLRFTEFQFLLGSEFIDNVLLKSLFNDVFDVNKNKVADIFMFQIY